MSKVPTKKKYLRAKKIVDAYENEQKRLYDIKVEGFRKDLEEYFKNNLIDGFYRLYQFRLEGSDIIPISPCMEENYNGGNNEDIKKLCKKHNVDFSFIYRCYHK